MVLFAFMQNRYVFQQCLKTSFLFFSIFHVRCSVYTGQQISLFEFAKDCAFQLKRVITKISELHAT